MTTATPFETTAHGPQSQGPLRRAEMWLDRKGKAAWIILMVIGFVLFWPVGLAILAFMLLNNKFKSTRRHDMPMTFCTRSKPHNTTGNSAFDAYKAETLRRLEEEQQSFEGFLQRLRETKDQAEFDAFMEERAEKAAAPQADTDEPAKT